jgi:hypothetical protein
VEHKLYLTADSTLKPTMPFITRVKAALEHFDKSASYAEAATVLQEAIKVGVELLGTSDELEVVEAAASMLKGSFNEALMSSLVDPTEDELAEAVRVRVHDVPEALVPDEDFEAGVNMALKDLPALRPEAASTALVLMGMTSGNPAEAAAYAVALARATGEKELFEDAIKSLIRVYPVVKFVLMQNGLWKP